MKYEVKNLEDNLNNGLKVNLNLDLGEGAVLFIVDPLDTLDVAKDTSIALMAACQRQGRAVAACQWSDWYFDGDHWCVQAHLIEVLTLESGPAGASASPSGGQAQAGSGWYRSIAQGYYRGDAWSAILIRPDPPVNRSYSHGLRALCQLADQGVKVINQPQSVLTFNEKTILTRCASWTPGTHIVSHVEAVIDLIHRYNRVVVKPLDGFGGVGIVVLSKDQDAGQVKAVVELLQRADVGGLQLMVQAYVPAINSDGDRRILVVDGQPLPQGLARLPGVEGGRGNLARGARAEVVTISAREREVVEAIRPLLLAQGLRLVGLDFIGGYLTEINFTSPTCLAHIDRLTGASYADQIMRCLLQPMPPNSGLDLP